MRRGAGLRVMTGSGRTSANEMAVRPGRGSMIEVLLLGRLHGAARVRQEVEEALEMGARAWARSVSAAAWIAGSRLPEHMLPTSACCTAMIVRNPPWMV